MRISPLSSICHVIDGDLSGIPVNASVLVGPFGPDLFRNNFILLINRMECHRLYRVVGAQNDSQEPIRANVMSDSSPDKGFFPAKTKKNLLRNGWTSESFARVVVLFGDDLQLWGIGQGDEDLFKRLPLQTDIGRP